MKVKNNYLYDSDGKRVRYEKTQNIGGIIDPKFIILHYTANNSLESTITWFKNQVSKVSSQIIIGKDGEIVQMAPLNVKTWHAGKSSWKGILGLNSHSIGIEIVNPGPLKKINDDAYSTWYGETIKSDNVIYEKHKITGKYGYWLKINEKQINALNEVVTAIKEKYNISEVLGHDDISPFRKTDVGPTIPINWFHAVNGNDDVDEVYVVYNTNGEGLNARHFPDINSKMFSFSPLVDGTEVIKLEENGSWWKIKTLDDKIAWVHSSFLKLKI